MTGIRILSDSHLYGEVIVEHAFPEEHHSLMRVLSEVEIPLRLADEFTRSGRPLKPKRHVRTIGGTRMPFLLPVDQAEMNRSLDVALREDNWDTQPVAAGGLAQGDAPLGLRGDFVRNRVFVEVEFGNAASIFRDVFKFQVANRSGAGDVGVLVVATERFARFFDSGVATFEGVQRLLPYLALGIQMPIWIVGIEPADFHGIGERYEEMRRLCEANGLACHPWDVAFGAQTPVAELPAEGGDEEVDPPDPASV
jgi:hypothetical protein